MSRLVNERTTTIRAARLTERAIKKASAHRHPGRSLIDPWDPTCELCARELELLGEERGLGQRHKAILRAQADLAERTHRARTATVLAAASRGVEARRRKQRETDNRVSVYLRQHRMSTDSRHVAAHVARGLGMPRRVGGR
jgi:hypothetical protein